MLICRVYIRPRRKQKETKSKFIFWRLDYKDISFHSESKTYQSSLWPACLHHGHTAAIWGCSFTFPENTWSSRSLVAPQTLHTRCTALLKCQEGHFTLSNGQSKFLWLEYYTQELVLFLALESWFSWYKILQS